MFLVGTLIRFGFVTAWLFHLVACMGGCLGCDAKHKLMKDQETQPSKSFMAEGVWTSSRCEKIDNIVVHSLGNVSSNNTPDVTFDSHGIKKMTDGFINHGFLLWNQSRQQWIGNKIKSNQGEELCEPRLSWNATYDRLLGNNNTFAKPVPLSEMVDFLVDVWHQEGMYKPQLLN